MIFCDFQFFLFHIQNINSLQWSPSFRVLIMRMISDVRCYGYICSGWLVDVFLSQIQQLAWLLIFVSIHIKVSWFFSCLTHNRAKMVRDEWILK